MENKAYILKVLYNVRYSLDSKRLAFILRKIWPQIPNPWSNDYITSSRLQELFRIADRNILMDKPFKGTVHIYRVIDLYTNMAGKSFCTTMKGTEKYSKDSNSSILMTENIKSKRILAYFEDRDEVIVDLDDAFLYDSQLYSYMVQWNQEEKEKKKMIDRLFDGYQDFSFTAGEAEILEKCTKEDDMRTKIHYEVCNVMEQVFTDEEKSEPLNKYVCGTLDEPEKLFFSDENKVMYSSYFDSKLLKKVSSVKGAEADFIRELILSVSDCERIIFNMCKNECTERENTMLDKILKCYDMSTYYDPDQAYFIMERNFLKENNYSVDTILSLMKKGFLTLYILQRYVENEEKPCLCFYLNFDKIFCTFSYYQYMRAFSALKGDVVRITDTDFVVNKEKYITDFFEGKKLPAIDAFKPKNMELEGCE